MNQSKTVSNEKKQNKYIKPIIIICSLLLVGVVIGLLLLKPVVNLNNVSRAAEIGLVDGSYQEVRKNCPAGIEFDLVCMRGFYVYSSTESIEEIAFSALKSKGYSIKRLTRGYDGPNQKALVAYSPKKDVTLAVIITETDNEAYKNSQGNVRVEAYMGKNKYDIHDLTQPET